jgi:ATP-dependent DNA helicase RecG
LPGHRPALSCAAFADRSAQPAWHRPRAQGAIVTITGRVDRHQAPPQARATFPTASSCTTRPASSRSSSFAASRRGWRSSCRRRRSDRQRQDRLVQRPRLDGAPGLHRRASEAENLPLVEPIYPLTAGLAPKTLRKIIEAALPRTPEMPEWIDLALTAQAGIALDPRQLPYAARAARPSDIDPQAPARRRLAYDEFLAGQLSLALVRQRLRKVAGKPVHATGIVSRQDPAAAVLADAEPDDRD